MKKSKYVTSWFVTKDPNNVYTLLINTTQRYCYHHCYSSGDDFISFIICENEHQDFNKEKIILDIPNFLPKIDGVWQEASNVNKDQISYYFIPYHFDWIKEENIVISSKTKTKENSKL